MGDQDLIERFLSGDVRALSKLISVVEDGDDSPLHEISEITGDKNDMGGRSLTIGITGSPGSGKSTLIGQIAEICDMRVGIIAIDPSSPSSGGALLGDRLRMFSSNAYIRSVSSRGGGSISKRTYEIARLLELFGMELILIETVGSGQGEVGIAEIADFVLLVITPESGDEIQYLKSGIMELADVIALNKCDLDGWEKTYTYLKSWFPDTGIIKTKGVLSDGIYELLSSINEKAAELRKSGDLDKRRRKRTKSWISERIRRELIDGLMYEKREEIEELAEKVASGELSSRIAIEVVRR